MKNLLFITLAMLLSSCSLLYGKLGGDFDYKPNEYEKLPKHVKDFVEKSYDGIDLKKLRDTHLHIVGLGNSGSGIWVNPDMQDWYNHLSKYNRFNVYISASGVDDKSQADEQYVARLVELMTYQPHFIPAYALAFDYHYKLDGTKDLTHSEFHVPNEYIWKLSQEHPVNFKMVASVHPYRKDAIQELEKWAARGVKFVKWLPNAMGIDPANKKVIPFYKALKKYNMTLITHAGEEKAVEGDKFQELGNPLRLRHALDLGVDVIISHAASRGKCEDLDNGGEQAECSDLFWRLFKEKKYEKNLFTDLSALIIYERLSEPLIEMIENKQFHSRVMYGSDYPLPAINWIYRTTDLVEKGFITEEEREILNEIYSINPLLFHFVALRTVRHPKTGEKLTNEAFEMPARLLKK
ncbi:amidohydrolase family protein [Halobacteriovorax sp. RT-2-4]|uniref:amidohydrolase family protein n=1 Tax=unclassified Halobacteriovorax TaxID=2639665 RepID=UPI0039999859